MPVNINILETSPEQPFELEYEYSRATIPARSALENALVSTENGTRGLAFFRISFVQKRRCN